MNEHCVQNRLIFFSFFWDSTTESCFNFQYNVNHLSGSTWKLSRPLLTHINFALNLVIKIRFTKLYCWLWSTNTKIEKNIGNLSTNVLRSSQRGFVSKGSASMFFHRKKRRRHSSNYAFILCRSLNDFSSMKSRKLLHRNIIKSTFNGH